MDHSGYRNSKSKLFWQKKKLTIITIGYGPWSMDYRLNNMYEFHTDYKKYFDIQLANAREWVLPFIKEVRPLGEGTQLLEIGCGQGSLLKAFSEEGCTCVGVEMFPLWLEKANEW